MSKKIITLNPGERIIAVVPEYVSGPGWRNEVVWVYIATDNRELRMEDIQPEERTAAMSVLFPHGADMAHALIAAVPTKKPERNEHCKEGIL